ncbi:hypothetical protein DPMN_153149 [Dreissena polymorpha]|uniref:Methionyl/Valyl/Leucyl/Isoleucyl-tRNA synthetase anticodon-binding domain-containing protein n=1 Tax=Dreissena polymorpha TaxID=45954 RepID=A0A9D4FI38_DREPO|nr:hypothetical protein DPMN_153149 [Dreissena polymorpha]
MVCTNFVEDLVTTLYGIFKEDDGHTHRPRCSRCSVVCGGHIPSSLSPFMPFLTEELYQRQENCNTNASIFCLTQYPDPLKYNWYNGDLESTFDLYIKAPESDQFEDFLAVFASQWKCQSITFVNRDQALSGCIRKNIVPGLDVYIKVQDFAKVQVMIKNLEEKHHNLVEKMTQLVTKVKKKHNYVDDKVVIVLHCLKLTPIN